jgi:hypothetical protein
MCTPGCVCRYIPALKAVPVGKPCNCQHPMPTTTRPTPLLSPRPAVQPRPQELPPLHPHSVHTQQPIASNKAQHAYEGWPPFICGAVQLQTQLRVQTGALPRHHPGALCHSLCSPANPTSSLRHAHHGHTHAHHGHSHDACCVPSVSQGQQEQSLLAIIQEATNPMFNSCNPYSPVHPHHASLPHPCLVQHTCDTTTHPNPQAFATEQTTAARLQLQSPRSPCWGCCESIPTGVALAIAVSHMRYCHEPSCMQPLHWADGFTPSEAAHCCI